MASFYVEIKSFDHWNPHPEARVAKQIRQYEVEVARQGGRIVLSETHRLNAIFCDHHLKVGKDLPPPPGDHGMSLYTVYRTYRASQLPSAEVLPAAFAPEEASPVSLDKAA